MNRETLLAAVKVETRRLERSARLLSYRRLNWQVETSHKIRRYFEAFVQSARSQEYPFRLHVTQHETGAEGVIQISATMLPTGAVKRSITTDAELGERISDALVVEEGGALVASLSVSGHVHFVVYPRKSDRIRPAEEQIFLYHRLDPTDVTEAILRKVVLRYMLYMRSTSILGIHDTLSLREYALLIGMKMGDVRFLYKTSRAFISMKSEWGKLLAAGLIAWLVAYLTTSAK